MNKTILITGATDGIGLLTAQILAGHGHMILLHGRSETKLQAAAQTIRDTTETYLADFSSLSEVSDMAERICANHNQIDVLINNAGVLKAPTPILPNGQDLRFVVNTLAPYVLTRSLLPIMPKAGRILNLSSAAQAAVDLKALRGGVRLDDMNAYAQSKLGITLWTQELAKKLPDGPALIAVNPGSLLASKMVKEGFGIAGNDLRIGANILCRLALDEEFAGASGQYWDNDAGKFSPPNIAAPVEKISNFMSALDELTR